MADQRQTFGPEGVAKAIEVASSMLIALAQLNREQEEILDKVEEGHTLPPGFVYREKKDRIKKVIKDQGSSFGSNGRYGEWVIKFGEAMFRSEIGFLAGDSRRRKAEALKHEEERQRLAAVRKKNQLSLSFA